MLLYNDTKLLPIPGLADGLVRLTALVKPGDPEGPPPRERIARQVKANVNADTRLLVINEEDRHLSPPDWLYLIRTVREFAPSVPIGVYALSQRQWFPVVRNDGRALDAWRAATVAVLPVARECDFVAPSLYVPYATASAEQVRAFVKANLRTAAMLGRPAIPYLSGRVQAASQPLPEQLWDAVMEEVEAFGPPAAVIFDMDRPPEFVA